MKKVSLMLAFVGTLSAAAFANGQQATAKPQDGAKKEQAAPAKKQHAAKKANTAKAEAKPAAAKEQKKK